MKRYERTPKPTRAGRAPLTAAPAVEMTVRVDQVGARGDGVADGADGPVYAPFTLPGELVRARVIGDRADVLAIEAASPERSTPVCRHFGRCGGCQLQHWQADPILAWKRDQVTLALERRGIRADVAPTIAAYGAGRRRAAFHGAKAGKQIKVGFMERGGARLGAIQECPILAGSLTAALPALHAITERFGPQRGSLTLPTLVSDVGLDIDVKGAGKVSGFDRAALEAAAAIARQFDLARLSFEGEPAAVLRTPSVRMGASVVAPPPGAFLQATALGEETLARLVVDGVSGASSIADLFCGVGTFALRLVALGPVLAMEGDGAMIAALRQAADGLGGGHTIKAVRRDLLRQPLSSLEMKRIDAIVFDPPRSGAKLQAEQIAKSAVARVAAVSCDAATFARDARVLLDAGFALHSVTPVDQFQYSAHIEVVGIFHR